MTTVIAKPQRRPAPITGGWLPSDPKDRLNWLEDFLKDISEKRRKGGRSKPAEYKQSIKELKALIEDSAELSMLFRSMFDEIPYNHRFDPIGNEYNITNYEQLLDLFNEILDRPPKYNENMMVALPFTLLLEWPMATRGGLAAFLNEKLNVKLGNVLSEWGKYLADETKNSKDVIINDPNLSYSWLSTPAREIMQRRDPKNRTFEELYECVPNDEHLGFKSWDHFFTRGFKAGTRDVEDKTDDTITSGCESAPYAIKQKVAVTEKFWIKGQPYSLKHMLQSAKDAEKYKGGTVYQAFLSPLTYHRWHAPINGTITKLQLVPGSYFSISPINSFPDPETFANTQSQAYLTSVATRALIHLNNSTVGDMVMIPVGMVEVSTCVFNKKITDQMVKDTNDPSGNTWLPGSAPVKISKGDELGMFHFGGSTHCLIFGPQVHLKFWQRAIPLDTDDDYFVPLNAVIADVVSKASTNNLYPL